MVNFGTSKLKVEVGVGQAKGDVPKLIFGVFFQ